VIAAHIGGVPVEETLPVAGAGWLFAGAWIMGRVRRRRDRT